MDGGGEGQAGPSASKSLPPEVEINASACMRGAARFSVGSELEPLSLLRTRSMLTLGVREE